LIQNFVSNTIESCWYELDPYDVFLVWQFDTTVDTYIPACAICTANIFLLVGVYRAKISVATKHSKSQQQDSHIAVSLMLISIFYVVIMLPASISFSYQLWIIQFPIDIEYNILVNYITTFFDEFSMFNYSLNFVIYGCTLPFYREEARNMFRIRRKM
jgi:hypothetical protein